VHWRSHRLFLRFPTGANQTALSRSHMSQKCQKRTTASCPQSVYSRLAVIGMPNALIDGDFGLVT